MRRPFLGYNIHALFHANSLAVSFFLRNKAECCHLVTPCYSTPICSVLNSFFSSAPTSLRIQSVSITHSLTSRVPVVCNSDKGDDKKHHNRLRPAQSGASAGTDAVATQPNVAMLYQAICRQWTFELLTKM
jgi:hypothetical protein